MKKLFKVVRYVALYFCVTLLTAVGMVFVAKPSSKNANALDVPPTYEQVEPTAFENLMSSFMSSKGFDIDFDVDVVGEELNLPLQGQVYLDLSQGFDNIAVQGNLKLKDKLSLDIAYKDNWIYLSTLDGNIKINSSNVTDIIGLVTGLINETSTSSNNPEFTDTTIGSTGGLDLSNIDVNSLMTALQNMVDEPFNGGHKLYCSLLGIDLAIVTDQDYKIKTVEIGEIKLDGLSIKPNVKLDYVETPKPIEPVESDYIDLSNSYSVLNAAKNLIAKKSINAKVNVTYKEKTYSAGLKLDFKNNVKMQITTSIEGVDIDVRFVDNVLYVNANGISAGFKINNINEIADTLNKFGLDLTPFVSLINGFKGFDLNNLDLKNISLSVLKEMEFDGDNCKIVLDKIGTINILTNAETLTEIEFTGSEVSANIKFVDEEFEIFAPESCVVNVEDLLKFALNTSNLFEKINFIGKINLKYQDLDLNADYHISYLNKNLAIELNTKLYGIDLSLIYVNNTIYANVAGAKIKLSTQEIPELIEWVNKTFKLNLTIDNNSFSLDKINLDNIHIENLMVSENSVSINFGLGKLDVVYDNNINLGLSYGDLILSADLNTADTEISVEETEYKPYTEITEIVDNLLTTINKKQLRLSANVSILDNNKQKVNILCNLDVDFTSTLKLFGDITLTGEQNFKIDVAMEDGVLYVTYDKLKVKITSDALKEILKIVSTEFDLPADSKDLIDLVNNFDISKLTKLISASSNPLKTLSMIKSLNFNFDSLNLVLDGNAITENASEDVEISVEFENKNVSKLNVNNITINASKNEKLNIEATLQDYQDFDVSNKDSYIDLSQVTTLVQAAANTSKLDYFHITANLNVSMQVASISDAINMSIPVDVKIRIVDKKPQIMAQIGPIPVIAPIDNDVPYKVGDTVSGVNPGKNRILNVYYADGFVYFYRSETVPVVGKDRTYEKMLKVTLDELIADPMMILSYGCGFKDIIMNEIQKAVDLATNRETPLDLSNILLGIDYNGQQFAITLNLSELANNPQLDKLNLTITTSNIDGKEYITNGTLNVHMPISSAFKIDISSTDLKLNSIGQALDFTSFDEFISSYPYKVDEKWHASNGKWELASATTYSVFFEENGGNEVADINDAVGTAFELPVLSTRVEDDGVTKTTYTFVGWYTSSDFQENTRVSEGKVQRGDVTLYAKWDALTEFYVDVNIVDELLGGNKKVHALAGTEFDISLTHEDYVVSSLDTTTTYEFVGWFTDSNFETEWRGGKVVPNNNVTLYANWKVVSVVETRLLNIYDNGVLVSSTGHVVGETIVMPTNAKITDSTKWFLDAEYSEETVLPSTMPKEGLSLHIRNKFSVTIVDNTLNNETIVLTGYQGEAITLPSYATKVFDDGTKTKQETYTFVGFDNNLTAFPNADTTIVAQWNLETKYYYDVTFSKDNNVASAYKSHIEFPISELRVLEGTTINLAQYTPTWVYSTGSGIFTVWWHYQFKGWSTSKGGDNITSLTVTGNTTIYANWNGTVKTGKG